MLLESGSPAGMAARPSGQRRPSAPVHASHYRVYHATDGIRQVSPGPISLIQ